MSASVTAFEKYIADHVMKFVECSRLIGGDVQTQVSEEWLSNVIRTCTSETDPLITINIMWGFFLTSIYWQAVQQP